MDNIIVDLLQSLNKEQLKQQQIYTRICLHHVLGLCQVQIDFKLGFVLLICLVWACTMPLGTLGSVVISQHKRPK